MAQNCWAPVRVRRNPETFCRSLTHPDFSLRGVVRVERDLWVDSEPQVVVLAVDQAPGQGMLFGGWCR